MKQGPTSSADELFEHAACGLLRTRADGTILWINAAACTWFGYTREEVVGRLRIQDLLTIGGQLFHQTHCIPILQVQGSIAEVQLDIRHKNGTRLPVLLNIVRRELDGVLQDDVAVFVVNDRRSYERELQAARNAAEAALEARRAVEAELHEKNRRLSRMDRQKDEFLATLAHELRNPLAPMLSGVQLLKLRSTGDAPHRKVTDVLERQLKQITHLVDDLMEISRITTGRLQLRTELLDFAAIARSAAADVQGTITAAGHAFTVSIPEQEIAVRGDGTRLMQVLTNLLTNASKYTPQGGHIRLGVALEEDRVCVTVRDDGIGIPPEALGGIFQMFSQVDSALERSKGGLGIGLALVKGLVELHDGTVGASSGGVGLGSEFTVRLPLAASSISAADAAPALPAVRPLKILLVDDNTDAAETLAMALSLHRHTVSVGHDAAAGLRMAADLLPDVALLDIGLPDLNGYELARRIRAEAWGKPLTLIAITGWGQPGDKARAIEAGFDFHLTKPVDFADLQAALAKVFPLKDASCA